VKYASLFVIAFACAPAMAQDDPAKKPDPTPPAPAPADGAKKADAKPEAKKERKVDEAGMKALARHVALLHLPGGDGIKSLAGKAELDQMGTKITFDPRWSAEKGFDMDVHLPDELTKMATAQGMDQAKLESVVKKQLSDQLGIGQLFESPEKNWAHFDVACKKEGDDQVVELTPFDEQADADNRKYVFGKDGLIKTSSFSPKADPNNPQSQMMAGMTFDTTWTYEKKGEKSLVTSRTMSVMGMEIESKLTYFDGPGGSFLPKDLTISTPQGDVTVKFSDYTVDGKLVESTKAAAAKPVEKPADKPADKPVEKPADKPADAPPAPTPPAPKDGK
jgi:hypothetical protein